MPESPAVSNIATIPGTAATLLNNNNFPQSIATNIAAIKEKTDPDREIKETFHREYENYWKELKDPIIGNDAFKNLCQSIPSPRFNNETEHKGTINTDLKKVYKTIDVTIMNKLLMIMDAIDGTTNYENLDNAISDVISDISALKVKYQSSSSIPPILNILIAHIDGAKKGITADTDEDNDEKKDIINIIKKVKSTFTGQLPEDSIPRRLWTIFVSFIVYMIGFQSQLKNSTIISNNAKEVVNLLKELSYSDKEESIQKIGQIMALIGEMKDSIILTGDINEKVQEELNKILKKVLQRLDAKLVNAMTNKPVTSIKAKLESLTEIVGVRRAIAILNSKIPNGTEALILKLFKTQNIPMSANVLTYIQEYIKNPNSNTVTAIKNELKTLPQYNTDDGKKHIDTKIDLIFEGKGGNSIETLKNKQTYGNLEEVAKEATRVQKEANAIPFEGIKSVSTGDVFSKLKSSFATRVQAIKRACHSLIVRYPDPSEEVLNAITNLRKIGLESAKESMIEYTEKLKNYTLSIMPDTIDPEQTALIKILNGAKEEYKKHLEKIREIDNIEDGFKDGSMASIESLSKTIEKRNKDNKEAKTQISTFFDNQVKEIEKQIQEELDKPLMTEEQLEEKKQNRTKILAEATKLQEELKTKELEYVKDDKERQSHERLEELKTRAEIAKAQMEAERGAQSQQHALQLATIKSNSRGNPFYNGYQSMPMPGSMPIVQGPPMYFNPYAQPQVLYPPPTQSPTTTLPAPQQEAIPAKT